MGRNRRGWTERELYAEKHVTAAEREKRARLQAELEELRRPVFGVAIPLAEKRAIALRVFGGRRSQGGWPRSPGSFARRKN